MSVPVRHVVELRPPRKGERVLIDDGVIVSKADVETLWWVIVDTEPATTAPALPSDLPVALSERWNEVSYAVKRPPTREERIRYNMAAFLADDDEWSPWPPPTDESKRQIDPDPAYGPWRTW